METVKCLVHVAGVIPHFLSFLGFFLGFKCKRAVGQDWNRCSDTMQEKFGFSWSCSERQGKEECFISIPSQFGRQSMSQQCWADKSCLPAFNLLKIKKLFHSYNIIWTLEDVELRSSLRFHSVWRPRLYQDKNSTDGLRGVMLIVYLETMGWLNFSYLWTLG